MYTTLSECDQPKNKSRIRIDLGFWIFFGLYLLLKIAVFDQFEAIPFLNRSKMTR